MFYIQVAANFLGNCLFLFELSFFEVNRRQHAFVRVPALWVMEPTDLFEGISPRIDAPLLPNHFDPVRDTCTIRPTVLVDLLWLSVQAIA